MLKTDKQMDRQTDGQTDRWTDRQMGRLTKYVLGGLKRGKLWNPCMNVLEKYVMHLYTSIDHV